jgi:hypothetical protein
MEKSAIVDTTKITNSRFKMPGHLNEKDVVTTNTSIVYIRQSTYDR